VTVGAIVTGAIVALTACRGGDGMGPGGGDSASPGDDETGTPPGDAGGPDTTIPLDGSSPMEAGAEACVPPAPVVEAQWTSWPNQDGGTPDGDAGPPRAPSARGYHAMAWGWNLDAGITLLFGGGNVNTGLRADTWTFDSTSSTWTPQGSKAAPAARGGHSIAFAGQSQSTPSQGEFVLFGGQGRDFFGDTWTFSGSTGWTSVCNTNSQTCGCGPCPRAYQAMAFDEARNQVVMFGGRDASGPSAETWVFGNNEQWSSMCTGMCTAPSARSEHAMAFDRIKGVVVLFGGKDADGKVLGDTWEWNGTAWTQEKPPSVPSARSGHVMAATPLGIFLFGGDDATGAVADALWRWDGTTWTTVDAAMPAPTPRAYSAIASDAVSSRLLLFGGGDTGELGDTWGFGASKILPDSGCPMVPDAAPGEGGASVACDKLTSCCGTISNPLAQGTCLSAVSSASESTCAEVLALLQNGGDCR
jgi:hypothetical protein